MLAARAIQDERAERGARQPVAVPDERRHLRVPALAAQLGVQQVDLGEVEVGDERHANAGAALRRYIRRAKAPAVKYMTAL